jgi:two-component system heavy metal sensor histidine kinase CusS
VEAIAAVARAVAGGDLGARVGKSAHGTTETLSLGEDVDRMVHQLGSAIDAQRTFVSHAAHELRSPLSTIRGELQLALRRERSAAEYRQAIEETLTDVQSLGALTEQLLVLARVQATAVRADELTSLEDVVSDTLHTVRGTARELGVRVTLEPSADARPLAVRGERSELVRALRNLVDNAVNHSPPGGKVTISIELVGERISVAVVDQGPGVAPKDVPYLFEPFFRGSKDQASDRPGTGLGLPIARDIARAHGGDLRFATDQSAGCRFVLELPLAQSI